MGGRGGAWGNGTGRAWRGERAWRGGRGWRGGPGWDILATLPAWRVTEIPHRRDGPRAADDGARRARALESAYTAGKPVAFGWARHAPQGPVQVVGIGSALPAGAGSVALRPGDAATALAAIPCWTPIAIVADALLTDSHAAYPAGAEAREGHGGRSPIEEILLGGLAGPFGWVVMGEPIGAQGIAALAGQVAREQLSSPLDSSCARRAAGRHAELRQAAATGMWSIRLLAGGGSPQEAAQVARLLCASLSLDGLPYSLIRLPAHGTLREVTAGEWAPGEAEGTLAQPRFPCAGSSRLLAELVRAPEREVPGVRLASPPAREGAAAPGITLGLVLDPVRRPTRILRVAPEALSRHVLVCGAPGSGKSQTVRHLLESASAEGIPWLVIEPGATEYRRMGARLTGLPGPSGPSDLPRRDNAADVIRIRPGDLDTPPAGLNLLEPATGPGGARFPLRAHVDLVRALFLAAFEAPEPLPQVLSAALARCYELAGWDLETGEPVQHGAELPYPTLADLQESAMAVVEGTGYSREITDSVRGLASVRLGALRLGSCGRFLEGGHPLDFERLLSRNVVLELQDCGDDADKAFLMGAVLVMLVEYLRLRARPEGGPLRHLTVIEEAHRLLGRPAGASGSGAAEVLAGLVAEAGSHGEGLVIAERVPSLLLPDVVKNTAVKIAHRLPGAEDREAVGATMNLTDAQSRYLVALVPGEAAVFCDGMDYPVLARMPDGTSREAAWAGRVAAAAAGAAARARAAGHAGGTWPAPGAGRGAGVACATSLIDVRSPSCGPACQASPCSLRQVRSAWRAGLEDPRITLWAELAVLAHLTAWPTPALQADFRNDLLAIDARVRDCVIAHACDLAARSRSAVIAARVDPVALAAHVASALRSMAVGGHRCPRSEGQQWLAPACQWDLVVDDLARAVREGAHARRHPRSDEWELALGHYIPGLDCSAQLETVREWQRRAWSRADRRTLIFGTGSPSAVEKAVGIRASERDWQSELAYVLDDAFTGERWELGYLVELDTDGLPDSSSGSAEDA